MENLQERVKENIQAGIMRGESSAKLAENMANDFGVSFGQASRLIRTEATHIYNQSAIDRYTASGVKQYQILTSKKDNVCEECAQYDGKIYLIGDTDHIPPFHPNCNCVVLPVVGKQILGGRNA